MRAASSRHGNEDADALGRIERARLTWRLLRDPRVSAWMKAALPAVAALYLIVPIDLVPDFVIGIGQIDDLSVVGILLFAATKVLPRIAPAEIVGEHLGDMRRAGSAKHRHREHVVEAAFTVVDSEDASNTRTQQESSQRSVG